MVQSQRSPYLNWRSFFRFLIDGASIGALLGAGLAGSAAQIEKEPLQASETIWLIWCGLGGGATLFALFAILFWIIASQPTRVRESPKTEQTQPQPSRPFSDRLAEFTQHEVSKASTEVPAKSRMSFWAAREFAIRTSTKPAWLIRVILQRIRRTLNSQ